MDRKKGIVAMLDILGYSSLIENNDVGENTAKILDIINSLPKNEVEKRYQKYDREKLKEVVSSISYLVFSDTILLTIEVDEKHNTLKGIYWGVALQTLSNLFKSFLDNGLPLRGAVSYGEYITRDFCFAGKPIINAYRFGNTLNSAGILIDEYALAEIVNCASEDESLKGIFAMNYLTHKTKDGAEDNNYFVSLFLPYSQEDRLRLSNARELIIYLTKSFTAHNKGLSEDGKNKLDNTILLFEQSFKYKPD